MTARDRDAELAELRGRVNSLSARMLAMCEALVALTDAAGYAGPAGAYQGVVAVQARRRQMHLVRTGEGQ